MPEEDVLYKGLRKIKRRAKDSLYGAFYNLKDTKFPLMFMTAGMAADRYSTFFRLDLCQKVSAYGECLGAEHNLVFGNMIEQTGFVEASVITAIAALASIYATGIGLSKVREQLKLENRRNGLLDSLNTKNLLYGFGILEFLITIHNLYGLHF